MSKVITIVTDREGEVDEQGDEQDDEKDNKRGKYEETEQAPSGEGPRKRRGFENLQKQMEVEICYMTYTVRGE